MVNIENNSFHYLETDPVQNRFISEQEDIFVKLVIHEKLRYYEERNDFHVLHYVINLLIHDLIEKYPNYDYNKVDELLAKMITPLVDKALKVRVDDREPYWRSWKQMDKIKRNKYLINKYSFLKVDLSYKELEELDKYMVNEHEFIKL